MYENQIAAAQCEKQGAIRSSIHPCSPTLAQNIDDRISSLLNQVDQLQKVKKLLADGRILDIPIDDLRFAMSY